MSVNPNGNRRFNAIRRIGSWLVAAVVLWFLIRRLTKDWPAVQPALGNFSGPWIIGIIVAGFVYFLFQIIGWREVLRMFSVDSGFWTAARVWMNAEIIRYVPGNVWSVLGRMAQAEKLVTTKAVVGKSMMMEALVMVMSAMALSAILLIGYPRYLFPGRSYLLLVIAILAVVIGTTALANKIVHWFFRIFRQPQEILIGRGLIFSFGAKTLAWIMFAALNIFIIRDLGFEVSGANWLVYSGIFIAGWLIGYLSFITPSGLGVREAILAWFFAPYLGVSQAILVAVVGRVALTLIELAALGLVNGMARTWQSTLKS